MAQNLDPRGLKWKLMHRWESNKMGVKEIGCEVMDQADRPQEWESWQVLVNTVVNTLALKMR